MSPLAPTSTHCQASCHPTADGVAENQKRGLGKLSEEAGPATSHKDATVTWAVYADVITDDDTSAVDVYSRAVWGA
jgi:hypothetical protein